MNPRGILCSIGVPNTMQLRLDIECGSAGPMLHFLCALSAFATLSADDSRVDDLGEQNLKGLSISVT